MNVVRRPGGTSSPTGSSRIEATLGAARLEGLFEGQKVKQLSGRVHPRLMEAAGSKSGLRGSKLLEYALAKVALEDDYAEGLLALSGQIDRDVDLEF